MNYRKIKISGKVFIVDIEDFDRIISLKWNLAGTNLGYAKRRSVDKEGRSFTLYMHRFIMNMEKSDERFVDHVNHKTFDNRKSNLRICTRSENQRSRKVEIGRRSKYKGVTRGTANKKWVSRIGFNKNNLYIGSFSDENDAAMAYNKKASELFGEFALLNKIEK